MSEKEKLLARKVELKKRLKAIEQDYKQGLDADAEERAVQLENAEVLDGIARATAEELDQVEKQLTELG